MTRAFGNGRDPMKIAGSGGSGLDRGLIVAVDDFSARIGEALVRAAKGTSVPADKLQRDALVEAFNLTTAFIDCDGRHTDDELWALISAFSHRGLLPGAATPAALRDGDLVAGRRDWLQQPSELFVTLAEVDRRYESQRLSRLYYREAMNLAHVVASLDRVPSDSELAAIVAYQRLLLAALPPVGASAAVPPVGASTATSTPGGDRTGTPGAPTATGHPHAETTGEPPTTAEKARPDDQAPPEPGPEPESLEELLAELDDLIGLESVKEDVRLLSALLRVQKLRAERGLPVVDATRHLVFTGNPGTGKTTVARLLARIYHSLGLVEHGRLTEVDRSGLVAGFVGQTATKVAELFEEADGGVLLIDEAYSLMRGGDKDFGREAIDAIVKQVEDRRDSLIVILAGYPKEMDELVSANPGFASRFPKTILFPDYSDDELVEILDLIVDDGGYALTEEAREGARAWFTAHSRGPGFGNGRLARNLFEGAVARHARRLVDVERPSDEQLTLLEATDIVDVPVGGRA